MISQVHPGSASPWEQPSQAGVGVLGAQTSCQGSCTHIHVEHGARVGPSLLSEIQEGSQLSVHTQLFLLPCTVGFMGHEKIAALGVSQVPLCLAQT